MLKIRINNLIPQSIKLSKDCKIISKSHDVKYKNKNVGMITNMYLDDGKLIADIVIDKKYEKKISEIINAQKI
jgi:hypothetical protein